MKNAILATVVLGVVVAACLNLMPQSRAQIRQSQVPNSQMPKSQLPNSQVPNSLVPPVLPIGSPTVIHIHHYYNPASPAANLISGYAPSTAWHYGYQETGEYTVPWKENWGHLGFTGYLGQHGGGVDITPDSLNVFVGLVVDNIAPGSPAKNGTRTRRLHPQDQRRNRE